MRLRHSALAPLQDTYPYIPYSKVFGAGNSDMLV